MPAQEESTPQRMPAGADGLAIAQGQKPLPTEEGRERDFARELAERLARDQSEPVSTRTEAESLRNIELRAELREQAQVQASKRGAPLPNNEAERASADAKDFANIKSPGPQEQAAIQMAENLRGSDSYRAALDSQAPELAARVDALDKIDQAKSAAKEDRKRVEFEAMQADKAATAREWTDEQARSRFAQDAAALDKTTDLTERYLRSVDMALAARNNASYRSALSEQAASNEASAKEQAAQPAPARAERQEGTKAATGNRIESDEIFTASKAESQFAVPKEIERKYVRDGNRFYDPKEGSTVAFEDKGNRLETNSNSEQVAETMVKIALARGWDEIRVSGSETFRKEAWLEAAAHGMHVKGYIPSEQDKEQLAKRVPTAGAEAQPRTEPDFRGRETGTGSESIERTRAKAFAERPPAEAAREYPELSGAYALAASLERKVEADGVSAKDKAAIMAIVRQRMANSIERGDIPEVKIREEREALIERSNDREASR
jgi:hypothetical protein